MTNTHTCTLCTDEIISTQWQQASEQAKKQRLREDDRKKNPTIIYRWWRVFIIILKPRNGSPLPNLPIGSKKNGQRI